MPRKVWSGPSPSGVRLVAVGVGAVIEPAACLELGQQHGFEGGLLDLDIELFPGFQAIAQRQPVSQDGMHQVCDVILHFACGAGF